MNPRINVNSLDLGARATNALKLLRLQFIDEIPSDFFTQLTKLRNMGKRTAIEIAAELPPQHPALANAEPLIPNLHKQISLLKAKKNKTKVHLARLLDAVYNMRNKGMTYKQIGDSLNMSDAQAKILFQKAEKLKASD